MYRDDLSRTGQALEHEDARQRLDPAQQQQLRDLRAEQSRIDRVLTAPSAPSALRPAPEDRRDAPLAGQYPPPRLGHGGATLKPGPQEPTPVQKRQLERQKHPQPPADD
jgi:hypothetical protein